MVALAVLALAGCRGPEEGDDGPPPPFTWTDTAVVPGWEPAVTFEGDPPRNLLMISIDTLRRDAIGRYASGTSTTPWLDEVLATGVALDDHLQCANWTFASTTCTLAGRYNEDARVMPQLSFTPKPLPGGLPFLAGWLGEAGFHSIVVSANTWLSPMANNTQGFDEAVLPDGEDRDARGVWEIGASTLQAAMDRGEADRWYLHVHLMEPHQPYDPPEDYLDALDALAPAPWDLTDYEVVYGTIETWPDLSPADQALLEAHLRARYAAEVAWLDDQLRDLWADADARGWLDDTLVVLWSDHGESFWEHGHATHAWTLHAQENDAVALFWAKDIVPRAWDGPTSSIDLVPTLLDLWGQPMPPEVTGLPVGAASEDRTRFAAVDARSGVEQHAVRDGWKLRYHWSGKAELFDRRADPGEQVDRFDPADPIAIDLWDALGPRIEALEPLVSSNGPVTPDGW